MIMVHFKLRYRQRKHGEYLGQNKLYTISDILYPPEFPLLHMACSVFTGLKILPFQRTLICANLDKIKVDFKIDLELIHL